jgi:hypothetical protein
LSSLYAIFCKGYIRIVSSILGGIFMKKYFKFLLLSLFLFLCAFFVTPSSSLHASTDSFYYTCTEGEQKDGSYIIKISKDDLSYGCKNISWALTTAQDNASKKHPYIIVVEPGTYHLDRCLYAYSYTTLYVRGVTFISDYDANMFKIGHGGMAGDNQKGYYYKDITIDGGTWDVNKKARVAIKGAHTSNFTIRNATITNSTDSHFVEVAALDGFTVENCVFKDQIVSAKRIKTKAFAIEAIQIDILIDSHFKGYAYEDLTCKNITIKNNKFQNVCRGVGAHTQWNGKTHNNIYIGSNTFENLKSVAIECLNFTSCVIEKNTLKKCGRGITVWSYTPTNGVFSSKKTEAPYTLNAETIVRNNTMSIFYTDISQPTGIDIQGYTMTKTTKQNGTTFKRGFYGIKNVSIYDNKITSKGNGITIRNAREIKAYKNKITCTQKAINFYGMVVSDACKQITLTSNTISSKAKAGIVVYKGAKASKLDKNNISGSCEYGIWISEANVSSITNNTIKKPKYVGIRVGQKGSVSNIKNNTIRYGASQYGILSFGGSHIKNISGNHISNIGGQKIVKR